MPNAARGSGRARQWSLVAWLMVTACSDATSPGPAPAVKLSFTVQPSNTTAGLAISPLVSVAIEDASGTTVTRATDLVTVTILANSSGGSLAGTATVAAVNGVASFSDLRIRKAGTGYTLKAVSTRLTAATSTPFDIAVGPTTTLQFTTQPSNAMGGAAITPPVTVVAQDSVGNRATGFEGVVTLALGGNPAPGTLSGTTAVNAVNGVATFSNLSIAQVSAEYTLTASSGAITSATSSPFSIAKPTATLQVTTETTGSSYDSDGYGICVDPASDGQGGTSCAYGGPLAVDVNGSGEITVDTGAHAVLFTGVAVNCTVAGDNPRAVHAARGETAAVPVAATCTPVTLHITATTTGVSLDPDGYYVCVDVDDSPWDYGCGLYEAAIAATGGVTMSVAAGSHVVSLYGLAPNCTLSGDNPRTVTVNTSLDVPFAVTCAAAGSVQISTATSGSDVPSDGFNYCVDQSGHCSWISSNGSVTLDGVIAGPHTVTLTAVADNCTVGGGTARAVTVPPDGRVDVTFDVGCVFAEQLAFTSNGTIAVIRVNQLGLQSITPGLAPAWSPDGTRLAYECAQDICAINPDGSGALLVTADHAGNRHPTWSPDGLKIAFAKTTGGAADLYVAATIGSPAARLTQGVGFQGSPAWSPDGAKIAFDCQVDAGNEDICVVNADGSGFARLTSDPARDYGAAWKPDGTTLAFATTRYGVDEIVLMSSAGGGVTRFGGGRTGFSPNWSRDGTHIAFVMYQDCDWCALYYAIFVTNLDGTIVRYVTVGDQPAWQPHP